MFEGRKIAGSLRLIPRQEGHDGRGGRLAVRDRDLHALDVQSPRSIERAAVERQRRLSARVRLHLDLPESNAPGPRAEGLHRGLLRREAAGDVLGARARMPAARGNLAREKHAVDEPVTPSIEEPGDAVDLRQVESEKELHGSGYPFKPKNRAIRRERGVLSMVSSTSGPASWSAAAARFRRSCMVSSSIPQREGFSRRIGEIVDLSISRSVASVRARTVAVRVSPVSRLISPNAAPGSRTARRWLDPTLPWTETPSRPDSTTNMDDPRSPSRTIVSPAANRLSRAPSATRPRASSERRAKRSTLEIAVSTALRREGVFSGPACHCHCRARG